MTVKYSRLPVDGRHDMKTWVTSLGLNPNEVADDFEVADGQVRLRVFRLNAHGRKYVDPATGHAAADRQSYDVEDAPAWLHEHQAMAG